MASRGVGWWESYSAYCFKNQGFFGKKEEAAASFAVISVH